MAGSKFVSGKQVISVRGLTSLEGCALSVSGGEEGWAGVGLCVKCWPLFSKI